MGSKQQPNVKGGAGRLENWEPIPADFEDSDPDGDHFAEDLKGPRDGGQTPSQRAALELIANMAAPDLIEGQRTLELSKALELPERVIKHIEAYLETAASAAFLAKEAKVEKEHAASCWQAVKEQAGRSDDLVDMAEKEAGPCQ